jgi:hypothetical protein
MKGVAEENGGNRIETKAAKDNGSGENINGE